MIDFLDSFWKSKVNEMHGNDDDIFGPGTDLIISLLAVLLIVIVIGAKIHNNVVVENIDFKDKVFYLNNLLQGKTKEFEEAENKIQELRFQLAETKRDKFPPNIIIEGVGQYAFEPGKAELTDDLIKFIGSKLVDKIEKNFSEYNINVVEIMGHTDGQPLGKRGSNLDKNLEKVANGISPAGILTAGSNADLGLMRALAVVAELQRLQKEDGRLRQVKGFRAYSAAQLTLRNGNFAKPNEQNTDSERRRIEIRFTQFRPDESYGN